ncbi:MAG: class I SAM-dependent methyltransferase [Actinomycetota bacterium]
MDQQPPSPFDDPALYDRLFGDFDYGLEYYRDQARRAGGPVLDVACGTGRVLLPLLRDGMDVDGLDSSGAMLGAARSKAAAEGYTPRLTLAEMHAFELGRRYALVVIPFNSYIHNLTSDHQIDALRCCRQHLLPGGKLTFDVFFPGPEYRSQPQGEPDLEAEILDPQTGNTLRMYDARSLDLVEQVQHSRNELHELSPEAALLRGQPSETTIRWVTKTETELLLRLAGFSRWELTRAFDQCRLTGASEPMLVSAWI